MQKPCFDLERDVYPNLPPDEYDLVAPHIVLDLVYAWEGLWFRNCHLVPWWKWCLTVTIFSMYCPQMEGEASHVNIRYPLSIKIYIQSWHSQSPESDADWAIYAQMLDWIRRNAITPFCVLMKRQIMLLWLHNPTRMTWRLFVTIPWTWGNSYGDMEGPLFDDQFDGVIRIHGSGGSPEIKVLLPQHRWLTQRMIRN